MCKEGKGREERNLEGRGEGRGEGKEREGEMKKGGRNEEGRKKGK